MKKLTMQSSHLVGVKIKVKEDVLERERRSNRLIPVCNLDLKQNKAMSGSYTI